MTLNYVRALVEGGFADLHHPEYWNLDFVRHSPLAADYQAIVDAIKDAVRFMEMLADIPRGDLNRAALYTGHEALLLHYEAAVTREPFHLPGWYNLSTHMPWIGMRTAFPGSAHVEYARGIRNPIGLKVGPELAPDTLIRLIEMLHPDDEPGRLTLIHRFGADKIVDALPPLIETVRRSGRTVLWCCDPMHGNTEQTERGLKTRRFDKILAELEQAFHIHDACGSRLCGVHFELTGENVTECVGGARGLAEADLEHAYRSQVDPRLNAEQSLEMALRIVHLQAHRA
jgi:3-deoxy-7-phosphoheptulonate synthase